MVNGTNTKYNCESVNVVPVSDRGWRRGFHSTCWHLCPLYQWSEWVLRGPLAALDFSPDLYKYILCNTLNTGQQVSFTTSKCNICTFSTAGSSIERSWTMTGMWALIFSFTHSSSSWSWPGFTQGVSSSMVLLWRPSSLIKTQKICNPTRLSGYMEKNICSGKVPGCGLVSKHCVCQSCNQMLT